MTESISSAFSKEPESNPSQDNDQTESKGKEEKPASKDYSGCDYE